MTLTETEWSDILATLPEDPATAEGWEFSLVRRTVECVMESRLAGVRAEVLAVFDHGPHSTDPDAAEWPEGCWECDARNRLRAVVDGQAPAHAEEQA